MSVLIKGMEMPKCCEECVAGAYEYNDNDERCFVCGFIKSQHPWECEHVEIDGIDTTKARADFCPLIEIPTPHGRLGDLDELEKQFKRAIGTYLPKDPTRHMDIVNGSECRGWTQALMAVLEAKTVIKAED